MPRIKAIQTKFQGVYYRSRLEARWKCFWWFCGITRKLTERIDLC